MGMTAASARRRSTASKTSFEVAHGSTLARGSMRRSASWLKAPRSPWIATFIVRIVCQQQLRFSSSRCTRKQQLPIRAATPDLSQPVRYMTHPTNEQSNEAQKRGQNVVDPVRDPSGAVACRGGKQLHARRVHPPAAGAGGARTGVPADLRPSHEHGLNALITS